jgi:hypothetical protein
MNNLIYHKAIPEKTSKSYSKGRKTLHLRLCSSVLKNYRKMKIIFSISILLLVLNSNAFSQSNITFQAGTAITIQPGADVCANSININRSYPVAERSRGASACILESYCFSGGIL